LYATVIGAGAFLSVLAVAAWSIWSNAQVSQGNADVLCNVLRTGRVLAIERLAVEPGTADELQAELRRINRRYTKLAEPINDCDVFVVTRR
jgi:hypothetical protein